MAAVTLVAGAGLLSASSTTAQRTEQAGDHVEVGRNGRVFVYSEVDRGAVVTAAPGELAYDAFMELAGWPHPGQSRPLRRAVAEFEVEADGALVIHDVLAVGGGGSEAIATRIAPADRRYSCYRRILRPADAPTRRYVFEEDRTRLARCG